MKFLVLSALLMTSTVFAKDEAIKGSKVIEDLNYHAFDEVISGTNDSNEACAISMIRDVTSKSLLIKIMTGRKSAFVTIHPTDSIAKSTKGDGSFDKTTYKLPKNGPHSPFIVIATYEDISDFDLEINATGKKGTSTKCSWRE
jgi:mannose-6-phosphate isomerase class I